MRPPPRDLATEHLHGLLGNLVHTLGPPEPVVERAHIPPPASDRPPLSGEPVGFSANRMTQDRLEMVSAMIIKLSFAFGLSATVLAVFFALIYSFLRWVLA